ncbi:dipeptidase PepV [Isobaculum melis]|uniref:Succinyl-diaminopimelate desuccinylase n=1 Tax=Isobaculum melis TaxID=142588 RepID=A0A1H9PZ08_9LACT|nr:dipeptidase PepV [Isobaculum melis]SER53390.1 succinyl-diaminopimelate desuccinylase [Isobaculum melis]
MTIDWQKEAEARKEEMLADLFSLLKIDSVRDDSQATADAPVGPGPKAALLAFLEMAKRDGFETKNIDNLAGHAVYGEGAETMGVFAHVDVVPVGSGWDTNPFEPIIKEGKLYARGSSDDKGPGIAGYYAIKMIKELGLPISKQVKFIVGTDEESGWKCMDRYLEVEPKPDFGFSPDAEFPIINGEKGILTVHLSFNGSNAGGTNELVSFEAGLRENMVPQDATAVITAVDVAQIEQDFAAFIEKNPITGTVTANGNQVTIEVIGKAAHAMEPTGGINAGTYLATFLTQYDFGSDAKAYLEVTANDLHEDSRAKNLGIAYTDEKMGDLTMNPGIFNFSSDKGGTIALNFRFPQGVTADGLEADISKKLAAYGVTLTRGKYQTPHYVPANDPLVKTLLDVYEKHTGQKGAEKTIGGGTYGRLLERGVAYGALFPDRQDTMHQANEFMWVEDIVKSAAIYADAIYQLIK